MQKEIKVEVTFTEGYQKRFTEACLEVLNERENGNQQTIKVPEKVIVEATA